jgi:hypothetical protein
LPFSTVLRAHALAPRALRAAPPAAPLIDRMAARRIPLAASAPGLPLGHVRAHA